MKQSEWNSYWDKKINEHFNVKPAERIDIREFVAKVYCEHSGERYELLVEESDSGAKTLQAADLFKSGNTARIANFIDMAKSGTYFTLDDSSVVGSKKDPKTGKRSDTAEIELSDIPEDQQGKVQIDPSGPNTKKTLKKMEAWIKFEMLDNDADRASVLKKNGFSSQEEYYKNLRSNLYFETDYYALDPDTGKLSKRNPEQIVGQINNLAKTAEFGGKGEVKGPSGAEWEGLIASAYNGLHMKQVKEEDTPKKFDKVYMNMADKLAVNTLEQVSGVSGYKSGDAGWKMRETGGDYGEPSPDWEAAFQSIGESLYKAGGDVKKSPTMTYKTDVMTENGLVKMSFKKTGGSQLMSAGKGETIATLSVISKKIPKLSSAVVGEITDLQDLVSDQFAQLKVEGKAVQNVNAVASRLKELMDGYKDDPKALEKFKADLQNPKSKISKTEPLVAKLFNTQGHHDELTCAFEKILNTGVTQAGKKSKSGAAIQGNSYIKNAVVAEAMTGNVKFDQKSNKGQEATCNYMFEFNPVNGVVSLDPIDKKFISDKASSTKFYFSFKTGGGSSAPYSVLRGASASGGETSACKTVSEYVKKRSYELLLEDEDKMLMEMIENDPYHAGMFMWYSDLAEKEQTILSEGAGMTINELELFKRAGQAIKNFVVDKLPDLADKTWDGIVAGANWMKNKALDVYQVASEWLGAAKKWLLEMYEKIKARITEAFNESMKPIKEKAAEDPIMGMAAIGLSPDVELDPIEM